MYQTTIISILLLLVGSYVFLWINGEEHSTFIDSTKDGSNFSKRPKVTMEKLVKTNSKGTSIGNFSQNQLNNRRKKRTYCLEEYRTFDGSYNNRYHPLWGASDTKFSRLIPPRYSDGFHAMPISVTGTALPNVRKLSMNFFPHKNKSDKNFTLAMVHWGQLLAHDFARISMIPQPGEYVVGNNTKCCTEDGSGTLPDNLQHPLCHPIMIPLEDDWYTKYKQRCMNFIRSTTRNQRKSNSLSRSAHQLNEVSSYLDCSPIYGTNRENNKKLRVFSNGLMKLENRRGRDMLPTCANNSRDWNTLAKNDTCYEAGDNRLNQNPQLVILQTLMTREHNRIAEILFRINPHWSDEILFQESRRIVIAQYQDIIYHEWLPLLLGRSYQTQDVCRGYDVRMNPSVFLGFNSGAFRLLHSLVKGNIKMYNSYRKPTNKIRLSNYYFRPRVIESNFEDLLIGLVTQSMQQMDYYFDEEITHYLFRGNKEFGMDLEAIDLLRGRDHGIPGYNAYREICHLKRARNFDELIEEITSKNIEKLRQIYAHVDDIDLLIGVALEERESDSILGPTAQCLVNEQFYRVRTGDRFFYEHLNECHSFTREQLNEIGKVTLAKIICNNVGGISMIQPNVFKTISLENPLMQCEQLPNIDFIHWKKYKA